MNCNETKKYLAEYAGGMDDADTVKAVKAHLSGCRECSAEFEEVKKLLALAGSIEAKDPGKAFWDGYIPAMRAKMEKKIGFFGFFQKPVPVSLMMLAALILLVSPVYLSRKPNTNTAIKIGPETEAALLADIEQNYEEYAKLLYDDPVEENLMLEDSGIK